jgi:hypothetical protein
MLQCMEQRVLVSFSEKLLILSDLAKYSSYIHLTSVLNPTDRWIAFPASIMRLFEILDYKWKVDPETGEERCLS